MNGAELILPRDRDTAAVALIAAYTAGRNARTLTAYRKDLEQFRLFVGADTAEAAAQRLLECRQGEANALTLAYRAHLLERGLSPATINRRLASLRSLAKLARLLGLVPWEIEVSSLPTEAYRDTRGPGVAGFRRLLAVLDAEEDCPRLRRDRLILRLLFDLGLRRGEAVSLDLADVDVDRHTLAVVGKGRLEKTLLSLPVRTLTVLLVWLESRGDQPGPLLTSFDRAGKGDGRLTAHSLYKIVRGIGARAGLPVRPHGLRHTAITEAVKAAQANGMGLEEVLDFSRHRDVRVMMIYRDRERNVQERLASLVADTAK